MYSIVRKDKRCDVKLKVERGNLYEWRYQYTVGKDGLANPKWRITVRQS
jgi:hypothetical protein